MRTIEQVCDDDNLRMDCSILRNYIKEGTYARLPKSIKTISQEYKNDRLKIKNDSRILANRISDLVEEYHYDSASSSKNEDLGIPSIIISETFI